jgi:hypothetical protein
MPAETSSCHWEVWRSNYVQLAEFCGCEEEAQEFVSQTQVNATVVRL